MYHTIFNFVKNSIKLYHRAKVIAFFLLTPSVDELDAKKSDEKRHHKNKLENFPASPNLSNMAQNQFNWLERHIKKILQFLKYNTFESVREPKNNIQMQVD